MKIAIVGYDTEGRISYDYFAAQGQHELTICDQKTDLTVPDGANAVLGPEYLNDLDRFDLIVRTAGLPPSKIIAKNPSVADKITTHINEFLKVCPTKNIIGVTGTKGKGTTSTLITKMLQADGHDVRLGGNIGTPPITFLNKLSVDSWVVLELSSFQLSDLKYSPHIATCLMVVPEHLNWHDSLDDYHEAKSNLFAQQTADDIAIYYAHSDISKNIAANGLGKKIPYFTEPGAVVDAGEIKIDKQTICQTGELKLLGEHNWQNVCAAVTTAWQVTKNTEAIRQVLTSFAGLPHRLEKVREFNEITFYNDSFASTPDATITAMKAVLVPKIMIIGGFDRQLPLQNLAQNIKVNSDVKKVLIIGESGPRLAGELDKINLTNYELMKSKDINEIVSQALRFASQGDAIVFSPGFASFDMFKNFEDRGEKYKQAVANL